MSTRAVHWALEQRHLKPAPWRVLVMLADRHNKDTLRVDPCQSILAYDCNMARSTVNRHLEDLEGAGLLLRMPRLDPKTNKQLSTFYVLGIDFDKPPHIENAVSDFDTRLAEVQSGNARNSRVSNSDTDPVSQKTQIPCPKNRDSRVPKSDTNHRIKPSIEPCADGAAKTDFSKSGNLSDKDAAEVQAIKDRGFMRFMEAYPRKAQANNARTAYDKALRASDEPFHLLIDWMVSAAKAYARSVDGYDAKYIRLAKTFLSQKHWEEYPQPKRVERDTSREGFAKRHAEYIKSGIPALCSGIPRGQALQLAKDGLVTGQELRNVNLATLHDLLDAGIGV